MSFIDYVTPKDTEEVKPGLFIQKKRGKYRQLQPIAWKGKWRTKEQMRSIFSPRTFVWLGIMLFLVFAYNNDNAQLVEFHNTVVENPVLFCSELIASLQTPVCTEFYRQNGLCLGDLDNIGVDFTTIEAINETQDTNSLP